MLNYRPAPVLQEIAQPPANLERLAKQLKAVAEPKRLLILHMLSEGVQCNCELGDMLAMAPNLISHHLRILRQAGLVNVERDVLDARWLYYSINRPVWDELNAAFGLAFDPSRIKPRRPTCGPQSALVKLDDITVREGGARARKP
jgi:ArsR family transcriptional regulator